MVYPKLLRTKKLKNYVRKKIKLKSNFISNPWGILEEKIEL